MNGLTSHARARLDLHLRFHWYDEIASGRKQVEYRDATDYWRARLRNRPKSVILHRGYTADCMEYEVKKVTEAEGCFEIHLGNRIGRWRHGH